MNPPESTTTELVPLLRAVRTLLAVTACLLAVLVLGLALGAWLAVQRADQLEATARRQAALWHQAAGKLGREVTERQGALSAGLVNRSETTRGRVAVFAERSRSLSGHPSNPLAKLDRVIDLNVLISEELLLLMQHTADSQATLGRGLRPLPKPTPRGSGR